MTSSSVYPRKCLLPLVDMDGVIADLEGGFLKKYRARYPNELYITLEDRQGFWVSSQYGNLRRDLLHSHVRTSSLLTCMLLKIFIENKLTQLFSSLFSSTDIFICTSPIKHYIHCPDEKCAWIEKHLNKTTVTGDILIDDTLIDKHYPNPTWEPILFTVCHNKNVSSSHRRLLSWPDDWRAILERGTQTEA
uniref:5',3'-nucleotidase, mitochondrial n=1 Tax=Salmo trutta TaxID=8032 RepID=A0A673XMF9_SALTR